MYLILLLLSLLVTTIRSQEALNNPKCNEWLDPGECNEFTVKWYYDRYDHRCRRFYYGGCGGNINRFETLEECSSVCHFVEPTVLDRCSLPHDAGHCQSDIERWFFDMNKKQCVCSWWSGCGGNSNRYYSYNHCMEICGQWAEHGPGIDEEYWGKRNGTFMSLESQSVFENHRPLDPPNHGDYQIVPASVEQYLSAEDVGNRGSSNEHWNSMIVPIGQAPPTRQQVQQQAPPSSSVEQRTAAISWAEFHSNSDGSNFRETRTRAGVSNEDKTMEDSSEVSPLGPSFRDSPYKELTVSEDSITQGTWENTTKAHGQALYRFDSGPQQQSSSDGSVTTNRQFLVILEDRTPRVNMMQNLPGLTEFTHVAPPSPFSTMLTPMRRKIKKIKKQKVPPRRITPVNEGTAQAFHFTYNTDARGNEIYRHSSSHAHSAPNKQQQQQRDGRIFHVNYYTDGNGRQIAAPVQRASAFVAYPDPLPTQFYATYNTDKFGRQISRQKITWTGYGNIPLSALPREYQHMIPSTIPRHHQQATPVIPRQQQQTPPTIPRQQHEQQVVPPPHPRPVQHPEFSPAQPRTTQPAPTRPVMTRPTRPFFTTTTPPTTTQRPTPRPTQPRPQTTTTTTTPRPVPVQTTARPYVPTRPPVPQPTRASPRPTAPAQTAPPQTPPPRPTPKDLRTFIPTIILPTEGDVIDVTTRYTPTPMTTRRIEAEPVEFSRPIVERVTPAAVDLSIDDIIAMGDDSYDEYDTPLDEMDEKQPSHSPARAVPFPPTRSAPRQTPPPRQAPPPRKPDGFMPIVLPPTGNGDYSENVEFEITSYGDVV